MQLRKAVGNRMFPHTLGVLQWAVLILTLAFNPNISVVVTGAIADGGLKVLMLFHIWMFFFSSLLGLIFYRIGIDGTAERFIFRLSMATVMLSVVNIILHFINDFALLMKITELATWSSFNIMLSVSVYKIIIVFLLPTLTKSSKIEGETLPSSQQAWVQG
jgi:hypothetical protein